MVVARASSNRQTSHLRCLEHETGRLDRKGMEKWPTEHHRGELRLELSPSDRERFFDRSWKIVKLNLMTATKRRTAQAKVCKVCKSSFWSTYPEMICKDIGRWFLDNQFAPWCPGRPPQFLLVPVRERGFDVKPLDSDSRSAPR